MKKQIHFSYWLKAVGSPTGCFVHQRKSNSQYLTVNRQQVKCFFSSHSEGVVKTRAWGRKTSELWHFLRDYGKRHGSGQNDYLPSLNPQRGRGSKNMLCGGREAIISFFPKECGDEAYLAMSQFCKTFSTCISFVFHSDKDACSIRALSSSTGQNWKLSNIWTLVFKSSEYWDSVLKSLLEPISSSSHCPCPIPRVLLSL